MGFPCLKPPLNPIKQASSISVEAFYLIRAVKSTISCEEDHPPTGVDPLFISNHRMEHNYNETGVDQNPL
jgi:hypothetical protein